MKKRIANVCMFIVLTIAFNFLGCSFSKNESNEERFTVTYNSNGADGGTVPVDTKSYLLFDDAIVLGNTGNLTRTGYVFGGWCQFTEAWRQDIYEPGYVYRIYGVSVLYAVWNSTSTITVNIASPDDIKITKTENGTVFNFATEEGFDSYIWKVDGKEQNETSNEFTFDTSELSSGIYTISLVVRKYHYLSTEDECKSAIIYVKVEAGE